jgi:hypothetical protein
MVVRAGGLHQVIANRRAGDHVASQGIQRVADEADDLRMVREIAPWPQALDDGRRFFTVLADDARRLIAAGVPLALAVPQIASSERDRWQLFDDYNPRNAAVAFSEMEWQ